MILSSNVLQRALIVVLATLAGGAPALATTLSSNVAVDNGYVLYLSTSNSTQGTSFNSGNDWATSYAGSVTLAAGVDYYLHVYAYDQGGIAGFLGQFSLSGADHVFANGSTTLLTNTTNWSGNASGFNGTYTSLTDLGQDGVSPWGNRPSIGDSAHWIWSGDANNNDYSYFTTKITATTHPSVPEPATMLLAGLGLAGMAYGRRQPR